MQYNEDLKSNFGCTSCGYCEPNEHIDVGRMIDKLDSLFDKNDFLGAGRLLDYWRNEAVRMGDKCGELSVVGEQMGYFRKTNDKDEGLEAVRRGLALIDELGLSENMSSRTICLNAATTMKAFGQASEALSLYNRTKASCRYRNWHKGTANTKASTETEQDRAKSRFARGTRSRRRKTVRSPSVKAQGKAQGH